MAKIKTRIVVDADGESRFLNAARLENAAQVLIDNTTVDEWELARDIVGDIFAEYARGSSLFKSGH